MNAQRQTNTFQKGMDVPKCPGVYMILNTLNNKKYIGSSINLNNRLRAHYNKLVKGVHHNQHLQAAWNKYGEKHFVFQILEICEPIKDTILFLEQKYLDLKPEYNKAPIAGSNLGCKQSEIARERKSKTHKGVIKTSNIKWSNYAPYVSNRKSNRKRKKTEMPVIQYDLNGNLISEHTCCEFAAKKLNVLPVGIRDCCRGKQLSAYGYIWKYKKDNYELTTTD